MSGSGIFFSYLNDGQGGISTYGWYSLSGSMVEY